MYKAPRFLLAVCDNAAMSEQIADIIIVIAGLYILAIVIVLFSGGVPTAYRGWQTIHLIALGIPIFFIGVALVVAYPALIILAIIIAASARR